ACITKAGIADANFDLMCGLPLRHNGPDPWSDRLFVERENEACSSMLTLLPRDLCAELHRQCLDQRSADAVSSLWIHSDPLVTDRHGSCSPLRRQHDFNPSGWGR